MSNFGQRQEEERQNLIFSVLKREVQWKKGKSYYTSSLTVHISVTETMTATEIHEVMTNAKKGRLAFLF